MKLSGKEARELTYEDEDEAGILRVEARVHLGDGRWTANYLLVVMDCDGRYWAAAEPEWIEPLYVEGTG